MNLHQKLGTIILRKSNIRLSHRILEIDINLKKVTKKFIPKNNFQYQWVKVSDVENIALPKPIKKVIKNHGKENPL